MKHVLMSVTDKTGLVSFAKQLKELFPELVVIASGGTASTLIENGIQITPLHEWTGFPECFSGRVKTLHPNVMGGILFRREKDAQEASNLKIQPIDMVICNLYDFANAAKKELPIDALIEEMDIGGSTLIRASIKNYKDVAIVTDPSDYSSIIEALKTKGLSQDLKAKLAVKAINLSADYEACLAETLTRRLAAQETRRPALKEGKKLRYGENPDQEGWVYQFKDHSGIAQAEVLGGKELSYNNYDDATVAFLATESLRALELKHGVAIIKHGNLCGYATGETLEEAFELAWAGDTKSAFGGIISFTGTVDEQLCTTLAKKFVEVLIAPDFTAPFVAWAKEKKPNLRLIKAGASSHPRWLYKNISGGMLVQTPKAPIQVGSVDQMRVVTRSKANPSHKFLYAFGISAVHYAKSNAIAIVRELKKETYQLLGIGSGQPNRVDSLERLAIPKAIDNLRKEHSENETYDPKTDLSRCVLVSDGFFPFDDSIKTAAKTGIKTCIQPGGSNNDQQVIDAADEAEMCMIFTGERYFCH